MRMRLHLLCYVLVLYTACLMLAYSSSVGTESPRNDSFCTIGGPNCSSQESSQENGQDSLSHRSHYPNGNSSVSDSSAAASSISLNDQRRARQRSQAEARKKRKLREREREGVLATKTTLEAAKSDACDWKLQPFAIVKGQVCGIHYKVLGLDRKDNKAISKADVKRAYRQKSLAVHPDKNPSLEASNAFKVVQDAYECLIDDTCKSRYDYELDITENHIQLQRMQLKNKLVHHSLESVKQAHYYVSIAANYIYDTGMNLWDLAGELEVPLLGEPRPIGRMILLSILFFKARLLLKIQGLAYMVLRGNYELAKYRGLL